MIMYFIFGVLFLGFCGIAYSFYLDTLDDNYSSE